jgi:dsRNA-specific ribonuclease
MLGRWSALQKGQLGNRPLTARGRRLSIDRFFILNSGTRCATDKMVATGMEAIAGAVYLDGGEGGLKEVMRHLGFDRHRLL